MKSILSILFWIGVFTSIQAQKTITGVVTDGSEALPNARVTNLNTNEITITNGNGKYSILASPKEELQFTHISMDTVTIILEDVTHILNIAMQPSVQLLDEVVVTEKVSKQKKLAMNYLTDSTIVNTSFGYLSPSTVAYHLKVIDGSEFNYGTDVLSAIASRRSGIRVGTYGDPLTRQSIRTLFLRGNGSLGNKKPVLFEVDSNIFLQPPIWLDVSNIQRVGIIPGEQAFWRYGYIASGGVVVINTKNSFHALREQNSSKYYDKAKLRNNFVTGKVVSTQEARTDLPSYLKEMNSEASLKETLKIYQNYAIVFSGVPYFYLDTYKSMFEKYGKKEADKIIDEGLVFFKEHPVWLKALAYIYESQSRPEQAHNIYKKIFHLRPDYTQSFIDLANSYYSLGNLEKATSLYARHAYLLEEGIIFSDSTELSNIMDREITKLTGSNTREDDNPFYNYTTRLVFEWNDSEAEFDLQFVNPGNQYFNWKHTISEMPERIRSEKKLGYSMADFLMDDGLPGIWKVNTTYHGNKQLTPSYLKVTIYHNYGTKMQSKEIKTYRLGTKGANQHLFNFTIPSRVVQSK